MPAPGPTSPSGQSILAAAGGTVAVGGVKVGLPSIIVVGSGVVGFLFSFFSLVTYSGAGFSNGLSSWSDGAHQFTWFALLALAVAIVATIQALTAVKLPENILGFSIPQINAFVGLYGFLIGFGLLVGHGGYSIGFGLIIELLASIGIAVGALLQMHATSSKPAA